VTLTAESTGVSRASLSNAAGEFVFNAVDPATYRITIEAAGFKRFERAGVIVNTQEFLTLDLRLEIGAVTESVNVTEDVPLLETSNASTGQVVDRQKLVDLPNLGRNPFMMAKIAPNVVQAGDPRFNRMQDQSGSSQISIAGGPVRGNNYLLDGVPITDFNNRAVIIPSIEAVQEMKLQANTYDAEMGRTGGGVFNAFLKSGSNAVHGSILGYTRQSEWLANNFFNNRAGIARPDQPFYNYGGSFGGPIWIPKVYNGRNKTFFWLTAEGYRQKSGLTQDLATPTALERIGDFSQTLNKNGTQQTIYDPLSGTTRTPFGGNKIPTNRLDPVGLAIASYFPGAARPVSSYGSANLTGADTLTEALGLLAQGRLPALIPPGSELWLDGGHNPDCGRAIAATLADLEERVSRPLILILGMLATKDFNGFIRNFSGLARRVVTVPIHQEKAMAPETLADAVRRIGIPAEPRESLSDALAAISRRNLDPAPRILITGSLYLAGEVLAFNDTAPR